MIYEFKVKQPGKDWENTSVYTKLDLDWPEAVDFANRISRDFDGSEVRVNEQGSYQGHYFKYNKAA